MDVYKTHGAFGWSELMTTDVGSRERLLLAALWVERARHGDADGNYTTVQVGEASVGGIMRIPAEAQGMPPSWGVYVTVDNVDETLRGPKSSVAPS
jgi:predicted enzyme related to lactoylglutathione lyase